ncbi:MAG: hypothetical protein H7326_00690 [Bdellovibrionaceae bacterium]|nr:hypothetical protein [Pseudobdellovibrionaceae bacterium]
MKICRRRNVAVLVTSGYNYQKDKYGSWCHFFGMILWGYYTGKGFNAEVVGKVEGLGSNVLSPGVNKTQKQWFNFIGGYVAENLRKAVISQSFVKANDAPFALGEKFYLNREEDFRDRLPVVNSSDLKVIIGGQASAQMEIKIENLGADLNNCKLDIIINNCGGYRSDFKYSYNLSLALKQKTGLNVPRENSPQGVRVFFSACKNGDSRSVEVNLLKRR